MHYPCSIRVGARDHHLSSQCVVLKVLLDPDAYAAVGIGLLVGVQLAGCAPAGGQPVVYTDQFTAAAEVCQWAEYREEAWAEFGERVDGPRTSDLPSYPSRECVDHVLADLHVDLDNFLAADGLSDPYYVVTEGGAAGVGTFIGGPLAVGRALLMLDYGQEEDLPASPLISPLFAQTMDEVMEQTGVQGFGAAQYNFVTSIVHEVDVLEEDRPPKAFYDAGENRLVLPGELNEYDADCAAIFVHEARHEFPGMGHVQCRAADRGDHCDEDLGGAVGMTIASLAASLHGLADPYVRGSVAISAWNHLQNVNELVDDDGHLLPGWEAEFDAIFHADE